MIDKSELPEDWKYESLSNIVNIESGGRPKGSVESYASDIPSIGGSEIDSKGNILFESSSMIPNSYYEEMNKGWIESKDILIVKDGKNTGDIAIVDESFDIDSAVNSHVYILRIDKDFRDRISHRFLGRYLMSPISQLYIESVAKGAAQKGINMKFANDLYVPVPPLDEQERIVSVVEERLERVERLEKSVENIGQLSEEYEDSLFSYVLINSRNSEEENISSGLPKDENIPDSWDIKYLSDLVEIEGGSRPTGGIDSYESDIPSIGGSEITSDGRINLENPSMIPEDFYKSMRTGIIQSDDILLVKDGANTGDIAKISSNFSKDAAVNSHAYILRCTTDSIDPDYLSKYLRTPIVQSYIDQQAKGAAQKGINMSFADELSVPIPPLEEQKSMGQKIENVDNTTNDLNTRYKQLEKLFDEYKNSILSHAFQGDIDY